MVVAFDTPTVGHQRRNALKHHTGFLGTVQNATAVHIQPDADMDRIAGLTHEDAVAFFCYGGFHPAFPFRVIAETTRNSENIRWIGNPRQFPAKVPFLDMAYERPAMIRARAFSSG